MDDKKVVQESLLEVFRLNGWSQLSNMTQRDFEHISTELQKKSGIVISGITIKRLANGSFSRMPQIATLNAIANYFDFKTWQEYKASVTRNKKSDETSEKETAFSGYARAGPARYHSNRIVLSSTEMAK
jgi:transcriptional regulator with XRE-family HTH domain